MRILMVGDVVGRPGRNALDKLLPQLREKHRADFVIVNAENTAGGIGITRDIALHLLEDLPVDVITLGNHAWAKREVYNYLDEDQRVLRPANYPTGAVGRGFAVYPTSAGPVAVIALQGRIFMDPTDNPFSVVLDLIKIARESTSVIFIDFHAEATSEKSAMGWHLDGQVSAVIGTHTHVQTADEQILPKGTAYLTDVGMTGPTHSVIGMNVDSVLPRFITQMPTRFDVADGPAQLCAVLVEIDGDTGLATGIERIQVRA